VVVGETALKKRRAVRIASAVVLIPVVAVFVLAKLPPLTECHSEAPVAEKQYWFRATRTVVQPWRGPHHVYGVFSIPLQYKFDHLFVSKLTIQGIPAEFLAGSPEDEDIYSGQPKSGHYVKRVYLSTRTALWFLLTGRFGDLKASCHWWLVIADRVR
jgi:hypothetical protein